MSDLPDIDIDVANRDEVLKLFTHTKARLEDDSTHNTGVYFTDIPYDPFNDTASINYKEAEEHGYFKIDILNVNVYNLVRDEFHLIEMMNKEPQWNLLWEDEEFCKKVVHIHNQYDLICKMKPDSIPRMAMFLAVMRPGKRQLIGQSWKYINDRVWQATGEGYFFKKAHAISYAHLVALHINLLTEQNNE